jgi:hypothetical protein
MDVIEQALQVASEQEAKYSRDDIIALQSRIMEFQTRLILEQKLALGSTTNERLEEYYQQLPEVLEAIRHIGAFLDQKER